MPELPDLEVYKENLQREFLGLHLKKIVINNLKQTNFSKNESIYNNLTLKNIYRNGKELFFVFNDDLTISVHLMLSGVFDIVNEETNLEKINYKICSLVFENKILSISDFQSICKVTLNPKITGVPDALSDEFTLDYLKNNLKNKKLINIKAFIIDQKIVKGIGNAYADEILYDAKISPLSYCGKIPENRMKILYDSIRKILNNAIVRIKEINPGIISGEIRDFLEVHNKKKQFTDSGEKIIVKQIASKKTYYTENQIYYF